MTQQDFITEIAKTKNVSKTEAKSWFQLIMSTMFEKCVVEDGSFKTSYGTFKLKTSAARPARMGRNPKTGESIEIPASPEKKKITFSTSSSFKDFLNS